MTIVIGWWIIPQVLTVVLVVHEFMDNDKDMVAGSLKLLIRVIAILFVWVVYLALGWQLS